MILFVPIVVIVPIGDDEFSIFDDPEPIRELVHEVSIVGDEEDGSLVFLERLLERFTSF